MARPKGSKNKTAHDAQEAVHGNETPEPTVAPAIPTKEPETAESEISDCRQTRYHFDHGARIFMPGDTIPAGWARTPADIPGFQWVMDGLSGVWSRK